MTSLLTSSPFLSVFLPDQKRCAQVLTARPWSGFFRSLDAASAHWVLRGSWFSSLKHFILSKVPMIKVMAASCALESLISSSYKENAWWTRSRRDLFYHLLEHFLKSFPAKPLSCEMLHSPPSDHNMLTPTLESQKTQLIQERYWQLATRKLVLSFV